MTWQAILLAFGAAVLVPASTVVLMFFGVPVGQHSPDVEDGRHA